MSSAIDTLKRTFSDVWESVETGWQRVRAQAADALTRFRRGTRRTEPAHVQGDLPAPVWGLLASDVIEDDRCVIVRVEVPGMSRDDLDLQVIGDALVVSGEKRYESDDVHGQWRVRQCAYGAFRRVIPLPVPVRADEAKATCRDGVLRVELPKREPGAPRAFRLKVK
ncbi:MAG: Hsp20/alpha crystallin family protein [Burkholderiaceae bacterium]|nr:Hsp20/alpha crystallin family protein [Burkholderiaceae bacterium]